MRCYYLKYHHLFKETNHTAHVQDMQARGLSLVQSSYLDRGVNPEFNLPLTSAIGDHTNVKDRIWQLMNLIKAKKEREKERVVDAIWLG